VSPRSHRLARSHQHRSRLVAKASCEIVEARDTRQMAVDGHRSIVSVRVGAPTTRYGWWRIRVNASDDVRAWCRVVRRCRRNAKNVAVVRVAIGSNAET